MDKKNYALSEVIDFVTNGEDYSNVDSHEEEEIVMLPPIERAEAKTDCNSDISDDENEGLAHHMPRRLLTVPCSLNTIKQNLDESDQTSDDESYEQPLRDRNKAKRKKGNGKNLTLTVLMRSKWITSRTIRPHKNTFWCVLEYL